MFRVVAERDTVGFFPFSVTPDALVFLYATLLAAASCVVFALFPALQVTRADLIDSLKRRGPLSPGGFDSAAFCLPFRWLSVSS